MALGFLIKVSATVSELLLPVILTYILEHVIVTERVEFVVLFGAVMICCSAVACIGHITANRMAAAVSRDFTGKMRSELFSKTMSLCCRDTDRFTIPSLESRITTDTYNVHQFVIMMQRMGVRAPILLVGGMAISFIIDPVLALVMLAIAPFIFATVLFISKKGVPLYGKVQKSVDKMVRIVREDTQGVRVIKALSKTEYENRRFEAANKALSSDERRAGVVVSASNPIMSVLMNLGLVAVVVISAFRVTDNPASASNVIAFMQYFTLISMAMMTMTRIFVMYSKCRASAKRIEEVVETPTDLSLSAPEVRDDDGSHITFEGVSFSYLGKKNNVEGISFSLKKGESLGIIGATGSGKSTIIKLLLRLYEVNEGEIRINGRNITSYTADELSELIGVTLQNDFLYSDTVEENIRFGRELTQEEIVNAAKVAQAYDYIMSKPDGFGHILTPKGTNFSGGQRQRLLIARAIAKKPPILILDDASSALDYKTDAALRRALSDYLYGSTVITVAQRVSSVKNCSLILVIDEGKIIGCGTHEQLLLSCPEYKEISDSQMGGAIID
jgi:ATP-binding cassette subfamily B protein